MSTNDFLTEHTLSPKESQEWLDRLELKLIRKDFRQLFNHLIHNQVDTFFSKHWEQKPIIFRKIFEKSTTTNLLQSIFSQGQLLEIIKENNLSYANNMNMMRYTNNQREPYPLKDGNNIIKSKTIEKCIANGYTMQFFQPQRYSDFLCQINASFEFVFGSLAGASVYMTPANVQGLAPHHDDIEAFILQTEGQKTWRLWKNDFLLPDTHSNDIDRENLPKDYVEFTLYAGDMLYFPRGVIHEAKANDSFSTHVTISLYQKYHQKSFMESLFPQLLQSVFHTDVELRKGLPVSFSQSFGTWTASKQSIAKDSSLEKNREDFLSKIKERLLSVVDNLSLEVIDSCADTVMMDFAKNRLPPPDIESTQEEFCPSMMSNVKTNKKKQRSVALGDDSVIYVNDPKSYHCIMQDVDGVHMMALSQSKFHSRLNHMGHPSESNPAEDGHDSEQDEDDESDSADELDDEDDVYDTLLPSRMSPLLFQLEQTFDRSPSHSITYKELVELVKPFRLFPEEISDSLQRLDEGGYIRVDMSTVANQFDQTSSRPAKKSKKLRS